MAKTTVAPRKRDITRTRVIQAAIDCIYAEGFHAAHTNRIAKQAGVSWGVLQYHFGDKDGLLQAVLDHIFSEFAANLAATELDQQNIHDRINALIKLVWSLVSKPEYRVSVAILRNAGRAPDSAVDGSKQMDAWAEDIATTWDKWFDDIAVSRERSQAARRLTFASLRGLADDINPSGSHQESQLKVELAALSDAIHYLLTTEK